MSHPPALDATLAPLRRLMVRRHLSARGIRDQRVLDAMSEVPRECFVPAELRDRAYDDSALPIGAEQTISQPYVVAVMCEALELTASARALEVGAGSGYAAAVMARLAGEVFAIELLPELVQRATRTLAELGIDTVHVIQGDGSRGLPERAPFDAISVAAATEEVPGELVDQLAPGGRLVLPLGPPTGAQTLLCISRGSGPDQSRLHERELLPVRFVPLYGVRTT